MAAGYIKRLHDEMLVGLYRSLRKGNFVLVGEAGEGKSAALKCFSDFLIEQGAEFAMLPSFPRNVDFFPPLAKINIIDDAKVGMQPQLVEALRHNQGRRLNVIAADNKSIETLRDKFPFDGVIQIGSLSLAERHQIASEWQSANNVEPARAKLRRDINAYIRNNELSPRQLQLLLRNAEESSVTSLKASNTLQVLELIRPRIITLNNRLTDLIRRDPTQIDQLTPEQFEELVAQIFEDQGYAVTLTKKSRDGGIDVIAEKRDVINFTVLAQCKKYAPGRPIGAQVVREMMGVLDINRGTAGAVFTTSRFTASAISEAQAVKHRLSLNDYFDLLMCLGKNRQFA